jgi:hypothetical protein
VRVPEGEWLVRQGGWGIVRNDGPRPPRRRHRGGTPVLVSIRLTSRLTSRLTASTVPPALVSGETSGRLQQRDGAAGGGEDRARHRGGSDGVSCSRGDRQQVSCSAVGLSVRVSDRLVGAMKRGTLLGTCELRPPSWEEKSLTGQESQDPLGLAMAARRWKC